MVRYNVSSIRPRMKSSPKRFLKLTINITLCCRVSRGLYRDQIPIFHLSRLYFRTRFLHLLGLQLVALRLPRLRRPLLLRGPLFVLLSHHEAVTAVPSHWTLRTHMLVHMLVRLCPCHLCCLAYHSLIRFNHLELPSFTLAPEMTLSFHLRPSRPHYLRACRLMTCASTHKS